MKRKTKNVSIRILPMTCKCSDFLRNLSSLGYVDILKLKSSTDLMKSVVPAGQLTTIKLYTSSYTTFCPHLTELSNDYFSIVLDD